MLEHGYAGSILHVDLSTGRVRKEELSQKLARDFVGGWGVNAALAYDLIKPGTPALSPEMPVILGAGVLNGTLAPSTPKSFLTTKDPAANTIATAVGSGYFGAMMKWAGYDHIVIHGKAEKPVYLKIIDDRVEIKDASTLWGKDINEATDALRATVKGNCSVLCTGPAGENRVKIALALIDKCSTMGRSNGGNLGSKNLKAVLVQGNKGVKLAQEKKFLAEADKLKEAALKDPLRDKWVELGLYFVFSAWLKAGFFIHENQTRIYPQDKAEKLFGMQHFLKSKESSLGCPSCLTPDKFACRITEGNTSRPCFVSTSLDPAMLFGLKCGIENFEQTMQLHDIANRLGIDELTFGAIFDFCYDLSKKGVLTREDTRGAALKQDFQTVKALLEDTVRRKGFGEVMAEGWIGALKKLDKGLEEEGYHIKGTEPDFDARVSLGVETFGAVTNPRGAHDMPVGGLTIARGRNVDFFKKITARMGFSAQLQDRIFTDSGFDLGRLTAHYENWAILLNCLGICFRMQSSRLYDLQSCASLYSSATGIETGGDELIQAVDRSFNIYRAANMREGFSRKDDRFPARWFQPLKKDDSSEIRLQDYFGTKVITREEAEKLLDSYYEEKGWDISSGKPSRKKLEEMGLSQVASDLWGK